VGLVAGQTPIDEVKAVLQRLRRVQAGDLILADDHNNLVDYAEANARALQWLEQRLAEVEQAARAGAVTYAPASGVTPWDALRGSQLLRDLWNLIAREALGYGYVPVVSDDHPLYFSGAYVTVTSARLAQSTTYMELEDTYIYDVTPTRALQVVYAGACATNYVIATMTRIRARGLAEGYYMVAMLGGSMVGYPFAFVGVEPGDTITVCDAAGCVPTGIVFSDWLIIVVARHETNYPDGFVAILDTSLSVLYQKQLSTTLTPVCGSVLLADMYDTTISPPDAMTFEHDWVAAAAYTPPTTR